MNAARLAEIREWVEHSNSPTVHATVTELLACVGSLQARPLLEELQAIKERADAATPGPWIESGYGPFIIEGPVTDEARGFLANVTLQGPRSGRANAAFISHSRADIDRLLRYLATTLRELEDLRRFLPDMLADYAAASGDGRAAEAFAEGRVAGAKEIRQAMKDAETKSERWQQGWVHVLRTVEAIAERRA